MECKKCGRADLEADDFHKKGHGLQPRCKLCANEAARASYLRNRDKCIKREAARKRILYTSVSHMKIGPCTDCKLRFPPWAMEFDHVAGKEASVSSMARGGVPLHKIKREVAKCELVCVLCHRTRTSIRPIAQKQKLGDTRKPCLCPQHGLVRVVGCRLCKNAGRLEKYYAQRSRENARAVANKQKRRRLLAAAVKGKPCADCGRVFSAEQMDFDHISGTKVFNLSRMIADSHRDMYAELEKCELVCAVCHGYRTRVRNKKNTAEDDFFMAAWHTGF